MNNLDVQIDHVLQQVRKLEFLARVDVGLERALNGAVIPRNGLGTRLRARRLAVVSRLARSLEEASRERR